MLVCVYACACLLCCLFANVCECILGRLTVNAVCMYVRDCLLTCLCDGLLGVACLVYLVACLIASLLACLFVCLLASLLPCLFA